MNEYVWLMTEAAPDLEIGLHVGVGGHTCFALRNQLNKKRSIRDVLLLFTSQALTTYQTF